MASGMSTLIITPWLSFGGDGIGAWCGSHNEYVRGGIHGDQWFFADSHRARVRSMMDDGGAL